MMFLLDTDVLSTFRKKQPHPAVLSWVAGIGWRDLITTVVTVAEVQRGIERSRPRHPQTAKETEAWLDTMLTVGEPQVLPMTIAATRLLGRMYETPALRNFVVFDSRARTQATGAELSIAAIAISVGGVVTTINVTHFLQVHAAFPLPGLFDPMHRRWHVQSAALREASGNFPWRATAPQE